VYNKGGCTELALMIFTNFALCHYCFMLLNFYKWFTCQKFQYVP